MSDNEAVAVYTEQRAEMLLNAGSGWQLFFAATKRTEFLGEKRVVYRILVGGLRVREGGSAEKAYHKLRLRPGSRRRRLHLPVFVFELLEGGACSKSNSQRQEAAGMPSQTRFFN